MEKAPLTQAERNRRHAKKRPAVAVRLDLGAKARLDAYAAERGVTPTRAAEILILRALLDVDRESGGS